MDIFNWEVLAIVIDLNIPEQRVVRVLDRIVTNRGYPLTADGQWPDTGLADTGTAGWGACGEHGVMLEFIRPGKSTENLFIERFNRTCRTKRPDFYLFRTLNEAWEITELWLTEYNSERPVNL